MGQRSKGRVGRTGTVNVAPVFRFYDPDIGRFIDPDPIGLAGGYNFY
ncbi:MULTISPECIES: RHS repeat-associated core domain-containing protein [Burkholderia]|nr:hypothetical protein [Burkholderia cepacia]MCA8397048.1 hypothetical protein [Burkholderia cepacia]MCR5892576.1 hypothetical protein [Burkholderia sp. HAN2018]